MSSEETGIIQEIKAEEVDTVQVGEVIAIVVPGEPSSAVEAAQQEEKEEKTKQSTPQTPVVEQTQPTEEKKDIPIASPAARRLAREKGIDLSQVPTSDPFGRIRKQDVTTFANQSNQPVIKPTSITPPVQDDEKPVERIRLSRRRQTIAKRLVEVQHTAAMLTTFNEIDMSKVIELRNRKKDQFFEENEVRLGFMSFFTKAVVAALKKYPEVNAELQGDELILKKYYDIGIAVSTNEGLVVPVIRDCDRKNFAEIEAEIAAVAKKARENKLTLADLQGGTFTITNGGVFGSLFSTPILNGNQVGILGMHTIQRRPVATEDDQIEIRPMMYVALSYDHRVIDGKEAVGFLATVKKLIENPEDLLLNS